MIYTVSVDGKEIVSASLEGLKTTFCKTRDDGGYGASDIGPRFVVKLDGKRIGALSYNGKYRADPQ